MEIFVEGNQFLVNFENLEINIYWAFSEKWENLKFNNIEHFDQYVQTNLI